MDEDKILSGQTFNMELVMNSLKLEAHFKRCGDF